MRGLPVFEAPAVLEILPDGRIHGWHGLLFKLGLSPCLMTSHRCASCPASAYVSVETEFRDGACLAAALREMGYVVEEHAEAQALVGYHGDKRAERAHVIVRRAHVGASANDLGWERMADGSYRSHVSRYDGSATFPAARQTELKRRYAKALVVKTAKAKGYAVASEKAEGGKVKIVLRRFS